MRPHFHPSHLPLFATTAEKVTASLCRLRCYQSQATFCRFSFSFYALSFSSLVRSGHRWNLFVATAMPGHRRWLAQPLRPHFSFITSSPFAPTMPRHRAGTARNIAAPAPIPCWHLGGGAGGSLPLTTRPAPSLDWSANAPSPLLRALPALPLNGRDRPGPTRRGSYPDHSASSRCQGIYLYEGCRVRCLLPRLCPRPPPHSPYSSGSNWSGVTEDVPSGYRHLIHAQPLLGMGGGRGHGASSSPCVRACVSQITL